MSETIPALSLFGNTVDVPKEKFEIRVAGYALVVHEEKILLVKSKETNRWVFPGGGTEVGETLESGMKREVFEETGVKIRIEKFLNFREVFFYYDPLDLAFQNYAMYFLCRPEALETTSEFNVSDDDAIEPTWVPIESLRKEDCQEGIFEVIQEALIS